MLVKNKMLLLFSMLCIWVLLCGCSALRPTAIGNLPPILAQDELIRPYEKLGRIIITREVYLVDYAITASVQEWGYTAVREEAARMGADAVIFPEVTGQAATYSTVVPTTEYRATGVAIKFK